MDVLKTEKEATFKDNCRTWKLCPGYRANAHVSFVFIFLLSSVMSPREPEFSYIRFQTVKRRKVEKERFIFSRFR